MSFSFQHLRENMGCIGCHRVRYWIHMRTHMMQTATDQVLQVQQALLITSMMN